MGEIKQLKSLATTESLERIVTAAKGGRRLLVDGERA